MDFQLSDEHQAVQETMRRTLEQFGDRKEEITRKILVDKEYPPEVWEAVCDTGILGAVVPEEHGGNAMGLLSVALGVEEMAAAGLSNAILILTAMDAACIARNGSRAMKERYLPRMASGELKFCFALTEPDAGSNAFRIRTLARRDGDDYLITGQKVFITGADEADKMLLACRTTPREQVVEQGMPRSFGLAVFVVDTKAEGIELEPIPTRGIEGTRQWTVHMDDVRVPASDLIGEPDMGGMVLFNTLNPERILASAVACGITRLMLERSVEYARTRKVFRDQPIGSYHSISHPLARVRIGLDAARLLTYRAAWAYDQDQHPGKVGTFANMAKHTASELAIEAVDRAIQTHGGYGFSEEYGIIYFYENVRLLRTAPISDEMILNFVAEHELGLPRSY